MVGCGRVRACEDVADASCRWGLLSRLVDETPGVLGKMDVVSKVATGERRMWQSQNASGRWKRYDVDEGRKRTLSQTKGKGLIVTVSDPNRM